MLILSRDLVGKQVLSLRTNMPIAGVLSQIINPNNLKVEGFYCQDRFDKSELILLAQDIRETLAKGYIVNDHDVLVGKDDLIRLKDILELNFSLLNKPVVTESNDKLGRVTDYATDVESMFIQKLYVSKPIYKSLGGNTLVIDRNQIVEITPRKIIINDILEALPAAASA